MSVGSSDGAYRDSWSALVSQWTNTMASVHNSLSPPGMRNTLEPFPILYM